MSVHAITKDYIGVVKDKAANFHGNIVVYFSWNDHLMFCAPLAFPLPPSTLFGALTSEILPPHYGAHPDWKNVDASKIQWELNRVPFTPGLTGYKGSHS